MKDNQAKNFSQFKNKTLKMLPEITVPPKPKINSLECDFFCKTPSPHGISPFPNFTKPILNCPKISKTIHNVYLVKNLLKRDPCETHNFTNMKKRLHLKRKSEPQILNKKLAGILQQNFEPPLAKINSINYYTKNTEILNSIFPFLYNFIKSYKNKTGF